MTEQTYNAQMHRIRDAVANSDWMDIGRVSPETITHGYEYFDQTLAAHDAEVAANAWDQGNAAYDWDIQSGDHTTNPYRADRIEREASNAR